MQRIFTLFFLVVFAAGHSYSQCALPKPTNVKVASVYSCNATMTWNAVGGAAYYMVKYKTETGTFILLPDIVVGTSFTFTGLNANTHYTFAVASFCINNSNNGWKQVKKATLKCSPPMSPAIGAIAEDGATFSWVPQCGSTVFKVRYKLSASSNWTNLPNTTALSYRFTGFSSNTSYDVSVRSDCGANASSWTDPVIFITSVPPPGVVQNPNFIIFLLDDGRYDNYQPSGGPAWFQTPSINRIANEGANFTYTFPTTSQCAPSRVSIYTGLYAHHHGALDNTTRMNDGLPLVQQILKDNGYYTGFVGKYGQLQGKPIGFNYWATSDGNVFFNANFNINNGADTLIPGHITDVYQDIAINFLNSVPSGDPFLLMFFTRVPHGPNLPRTEDRSLYTSETMPFPSNFAKYTTNYPSYFYDTHNWNYTPEETDSLTLLEFQAIAGVEDNVTTIMTWLESHNVLDSTMIIFTSDNGFLRGEHKLEAKQIAQEESIRIPLYIRFPSWFEAGSTYTDKMATNIDLAPSILEAAHIPNTYGMDGMSIKKLADGELSRKYFFYQYAGEAGAPSIRAVRSLQYKYVKHYCNSLVEEFYNLVSDPTENFNLVNNSSYTTLVQSYRIILDSIRTSVGDYTPPNINCNLSNPQKDFSNGDEDENVNDRILRLWPSPADSYFLLSFNEAGNKEDISVEVTSALGESIYKKNIQQTDVLNMIVDCKKWTSGFYVITLKKGNQTYNEKVIVNN
ncbi:MAG: sulfatase-like hydrolase/transferase [Chitinophagales bacterium]